MSAIRSMAADPARAERKRVARPNGWWGMAVFVTMEATLFGTILGTYFYLRLRQDEWPPPGIAPPAITVPLILTAVLVATSLPVQLSFSFARVRRIRLAWWLLAVATLVQTGYLAMQIHLFIEDLDKFSPEGSAYASIYFTMLGAHHAHVFVGILLEAFLLARLLGGLTTYRLVGLQSTVFYWHFVNALAVVVVLTQLSPAL